jgi:hypothetical protein
MVFRSGESKPMFRNASEIAAGVVLDPRWLSTVED